MAPRASAVLLVLLFVAFPAASAATPTALSSATAQTTPDAPVAENTTLTLQLQPDGDARWTITDTYALADANDSSAFDELATDFTTGEAALGWERSFRDAAAAASTATGREMRITNVSRDARRSDRRGQLVLTLTWTDFATTNGSQLFVGDAFNTTDGTWLPRLYEDQTLVISPPPGYGVTSAPTTQIDDASVRFEGPQTFEPGYLDIVFSGDETGFLSGLFGNVPWLGIVLVLALAVSGLAIYLNTGEEFPPSVPAGTADDGDDPPGPTADDDASVAAADTAEETDVTLLSDEERVERLLEQNGGRMKQARIVKETGWSNAKVSQLLSSMDDAGRIDKLRIGRENLISFPDEDVTEIED